MTCCLKYTTNKDKLLNTRYLGNYSHEKHALSMAYLLNKLICNPYKIN